MLFSLDYFYQYLTPVLLNNNNNSFVNPFLSLLASSTDGLMLAEYENYLEHSIANLTPGDFDWVRKVTLSSTGGNFTVVQTGTVFASNPIPALPVVVSSSLQDSALSSFIFGIWPIYAQSLISEDLSTIYNVGYPGWYLNNNYSIDVFSATSNYSILPNGSITLNTSTVPDVALNLVGPLALPMFTFFNNAPAATSTSNFYIINGRYQNMKIWNKFGQTILSEFLPSLSSMEQAFVLFDTWMSALFADVVQNIILQPTSNYWLSRAVHLVFGLPICADNNSTVLDVTNIAQPFAPPFTAITCSSSDTNAMRLYFALGVTNTSGTFYISPSVVPGDKLNKYDLFFNQIHVTDFVEQGSFLTNLFKSSPESFNPYLIPPYDHNLDLAVNLLQRRIAAVIIDPKIPIIFPNYLSRINYIFGKRFPSGLGYVTINYTPTISNDLLTSTDSMPGISMVSDISQTYGFNVSCLAPANTAGLGIDEDAFIFGRDAVYYSGTSTPA